MFSSGVCVLMGVGRGRGGHTVKGGGGAGGGWRGGGERGRVVGRQLGGV